MFIIKSLDGAFAEIGAHLFSNTSLELVVEIADGLENVASLGVHCLEIFSGS